MTPEQFRAQGYQPGDVLLIRALRNERPLGVRIRVVEVLGGEYATPGILGQSADGGLWAADPQHVLGRVIDGAGTIARAAA